MVRPESDLLFHYGLRIGLRGSVVVHVTGVTGQVDMSVGGVTESSVRSSAYFVFVHIAALAFPRSDNSR